jgi:hypothetical protein
VFVDCLDGWRLKLNRLVRSFPNYRAREILLLVTVVPVRSTDVAALPAGYFDSA